METAQQRFEQIFDRHAQAVLAYCARRTETSHAHDLTSQVFTVAWRRIDDLPDGEEALPWLYGVAAKVLANHRRATARFTRLVTKVSGLAMRHDPGPESQVVRNEEDREVREALASLSRIDREVIMLVAWEDLTRQQVAVALECSQEAAKKRYQRALKRLERRLGEHVNAVPTPHSAPEGGGS